ncbi:MATE family efflux transporter [Stenotrophomonas sp. PD6]|uniref:MATE family efflux transporter n=1 Tax=Stenotrophomonas sp. PD6 TaxID=3368612 RepID=UPI003BA2962F
MKSKSNQSVRTVATTAPGRFREEMYASAWLAAPLIAGHLATGMTGFVDAVIAGRHSTTTLAAVSVGTATFWIAKLIPMGTLMALSPAISRLDGAGRRSEIAPLFRQSLWLATMAGTVLFGLLSAAVHALEPMGIAAEIRPGATAFLHGVRWGLPALALYYAMRYLSNGLRWTLPAMVLGFGGLLLLAPLGYGLVFGAFGLPELGAGGVGIAWTAMIWAQMIAFAVHLATARRFADLGLFADFFTRRNRPLWVPIRDLLRTGLPIGLAVMMEGGLFMVTALLIGQSGATAAAAHQIAINVASLCYMIPFGLAEVTAVRVGHALGSGRGALGARRVALAGLALVVATQTLSGLTLLLGRESIAAIYSHDDAVAALAASLLLLAAAFQLPDGVQALSAGALRGLRDTRVPMFLVMLAYWGIGMPLAAGLGLGLGWGPYGMWLGLIAGLFVAASLLITRFAWSSNPARFSAWPQ